MNNKITISIERELFQWEKERYVFLEPSELANQVYCVQFYNQKSKIAFEDFPEDNKVKIPNSLLTYKIPITVIACSEKGEGTQVLAYKTFRVLPRVKPESYSEEDENEDIFLIGGNANGTT